MGWGAGGPSPPLLRASSFPPPHFIREFEQFSYKPAAEGGREPKNRAFSPPLLNPKNKHWHTPPQELLSITGFIFHLSSAIRLLFLVISIRNCSLSCPEDHVYLQNSHVNITTFRSFCSKKLRKRVLRFSALVVGLVIQSVGKYDCGFVS